MKLFVKDLNDGKDLITSYIEPDISDAMFFFWQSLPFDKDKKYSVSRDGKSFTLVEEKDLWEYPVIEINKYDYEFSGISDQGIGILAFNVDSESPENIEFKLNLLPSYISIWQNKVQIIFRLCDFIPTCATERTIEFLQAVIDTVEVKVKCTNTNELINPFCNEVESYVFESEGLKLISIMTAANYREPISPEKMKYAKAQGGKAAARVRGDKSKDKIKHAIKELILSERLPTQTKVAEYTGLSRKTVNKHWQKITKDLGGEWQMQDDAHK